MTIDETGRKQHEAAARKFADVTRRTEDSYYELHSNHLNAENAMPDRSFVSMLALPGLLVLAASVHAFDPAALAGLKSGKSCVGCDLRGADLRGAKLPSAALTGADLSGANLHGAEGSSASLGRSNLRGAVLSQAQLTRADLGGANLKGADLSGANLEGADLKGAVLEGANARAARLQGANLAGAKLNGADLSGTIGLTQAQLDTTCGDSANVALPPSLVLRPCR